MVMPWSSRAAFPSSASGGGAGSLSADGSGKDRRSHALREMAMPIRAREKGSWRRKLEPAKSEAEALRNHVPEGPASTFRQACLFGRLLSLWVMRGMPQLFLKEENS